MTEPTAASFERGGETRSAECPSSATPRSAGQGVFAPTLEPRTVIEPPRTVEPRPFGPLPEKQKHEWVYLEPGHGWGPSSVAYFRCMRCHIKRLRTVNTLDREGDVCHTVPYAERNRMAARERLRRLREEGLCIACASRPSISGGRCERCREERRVPIESVESDP